VNGPVSELVTAARHLCDALDRHGLAYALGGALAYGYWAAPRGTLDIDVNVFLPPERFAELLPALREAGCELDERSVRQSALERGDFQARLGRFRVDVFLSSVPFLDEAESRRVQRPLGGRPAWVLSAEDLATLKMMFFRSKDLVDVEHLIARQGQDLDASLVRSSLVEMVGAQDERVRTWDELVRRFGRLSQG
jgi:hypothetical protein